MSDVFDERGLEWRKRAELAESVIREALLAGRVGASDVVSGHSGRLAHAHRLVALKPYMRQAYDELQAKGQPFPVDDVLRRAEEIAAAAA